jgi:hypothetical protein
MSQKYIAPARNMEAPENQPHSDGFMDGITGTTNEAKYSTTANRDRNTAFGG